MRSCRVNLSCFRKALVFLPFSWMFHFPQANIVHYRYFNAKICDLDFRLNQSCSQAMHFNSGFNHLKCIVHCGTDQNCIGASMDWYGVCFKHYPCPQHVYCHTREHSHVYKSKQCANAGVLDPHSGMCRCVDLWGGPMCLKRISDCRDLLTSGYPEGNYDIIINPEDEEKNYIFVRCNVNLGGNPQVVAMLFSHEGESDFNRTWDEYRWGIFHDENNFWAGFRAWRTLYETGYEYLHILLDFGDYGRLTRTYRHFALLGETDGYSYSFPTSTRMSYGEMANSSNYVGNCFRRYENTPFSTWDVYSATENSKGDNCAAQVGTGWWFRDCSLECNLFGAFSESQVDRPDGELIKVPKVDSDILLYDLRMVQLKLTVTI